MGHRWLQAIHKSPRKLHAKFDFFPESLLMSIFLERGSIAFIRFSKVQNGECVKQKTCFSFKILQNFKIFFFFFLRKAGKSLSRHSEHTASKSRVHSHI